MVVVGVAGSNASGLLFGIAGAVAGACVGERISRRNEQSIAGAV